MGRRVETDTPILIPGVPMYIRLCIWLKLTLGSWHSHYTDWQGVGVT